MRQRQPPSYQQAQRCLTASVGNTVTCLDLRFAHPLSSHLTSPLYPHSIKAQTITGALHAVQLAQALELPGLGLLSTHHCSKHTGSSYQPEAGLPGQCVSDLLLSPLLGCFRTKYPRESPAPSPWHAASHEDVTGTSLFFFFFFLNASRRHRLIRQLNI